MPPWAQTLCERFTGTIENRSTVTPSSASLMVQARPARPPPTTITRFFDAAIVLFRGAVVHSASSSSKARLASLQTRATIHYHISLPILARFAWMNFRW